MDFTAAGWIWLYAGIALMISEVLTPGFVMFFFGLSAVTVGILVLILPEAFHPSMTWQLALFSLFSIIYLVTLRRYLAPIFHGEGGTAESVEDGFVGRLGEVTEAITPALPGRVMLGDAEWAAEADESLEKGTKVRIVRQHNLTLRVVRV